MSNSLSQAASPYLRQHGSNPVNWEEWGPKAFARAQKEQKPIFLSIGYSACHWCHVMNRESFSHQGTADILNQVYVPVKIDREERPELDKVFIQALMLITGSAGWPANLWLTPDLKPFYGGTYFPHEPKPGVPSFAQQLLFLAKAWKTKQSEVESSAEKVHLALLNMADVQAPALKEGSPWLDEAVQACEAQYDDTSGGFGQTPKFPQAMTLRFLLLRSIESDDRELFELVDHSAQAMGRGGLFDQIGGGFHRYCIDSSWTIPHFEKMLYDNAQLCAFYAEIYAHTKTPFYKWLVDSLVLWLERDMTLENGGFCASTDAEAENLEGGSFVWSRQQLAGVLDENERKMFAAFYDVGDTGNFSERASVLTQRKPISRCAKELGWDFELAVRVLESAREKVFDARAKRIQPKRDEKVIASWNGQMISSLCLAAKLCDTEDPENLALKAGHFLLQYFANKESDGQYPRVFAAESSYGKALAEDLASMVLAFFDLYELTLDALWFQKADELFRELTDKFWDEEKGLSAQSHPDTDDIPFKSYIFEDNAAPSSNSLFLECARRHYRFTGDSKSKETLELGIGKISALAVQAPTSLGFALRTAQLYQSASSTLILNDQPEQLSFLRATYGKLLPNLSVIRTDTPGINKELIQGDKASKTYLLRNQSKAELITSPSELVTQLQS